MIVWSERIYPKKNLKKLVPENKKSPPAPKVEEDDKKPAQG